MTKPVTIEPSELHDMFAYNPDTGLLTWKVKLANDPAKLSEVRRWNARYAGKPAITANDGKGYSRGHVRGNMLYAHRIAWAMIYGDWPAGEIDHINGDPADNKICNLRSVTKSQNMRNQKRHKSNTSGATGVHWNKHRRRWVARILHEKKIKHVGSFHKLEDAMRARRQAEEKYGYHPNHGRPALQS